MQWDDPFDLRKVKPRALAKMGNGLKLTDSQSIMDFSPDWLWWNGVIWGSVGLNLIRFSHARHFPYFWERPDFTFCRCLGALHKAKLRETKLPRPSKLWEDEKEGNRTDASRFRSFSPSVCTSVVCCSCLQVNWGACVVDQHDCGKNSLQGA